MTPEWNEKAVFLAALDLEPDKREAFLLESCPDDAARQRIRALLQSHQEQTVAWSAIASNPSGTTDPKRIDEFVILGRLGAGGMGVVYLAEDTMLGRRAAVKVLASDLTGSEQSVARFREEARHAAALQHPAIVSVYKFGFDGTHHYIASEFVAGPTLSAVIEQEKQQRPPQTATGPIRQWHRRCAEILAVIADALDYSHRSGIIHRDVKPSNILIGHRDGKPSDAPSETKDTPWLIDFGIAKQLTEKTLTRPTQLLGSCYYMSPEQATIAQTPVDRRSDIFSLGVVLYEMLALRRPFEGRDANQILRAVISEAAPRLRSVDPLIPRDLETICAKAIEKEPLQRYQTAAHMAADLRCFLAGDPILARPPGMVRRSSRWMRRHRLGVALASCIILAVALGGILWTGEMKRRESLAWVSVNSAVPSCTVILQRVDPTTLELEQTGTNLGKTPIDHRYLPVGDYRITIVAPDQSWFAEFNVSLHHKGRAHRIVLGAGPTWDESPPSWDPLTPDSGEIRLSARNVPTSSIANDKDVLLVTEGVYPFGWAKPPIDVPTILTEMRSTSVSDFYIDRYEVSNREYKEFVDATGHADPWQRAHMPYDDASASLPVVNITMTDAEAYARWKGKRLPTMYEWQAGACTMQGYMYPWGNNQIPLSQLRPVQENDSNTLENFYRHYMVSVRQGEPGLGGLLHTLDNAREFTSTIDPKTGVVITGPPLHFLPPSKWDLRMVGSSPLESYDTVVGFRCAKSAHAPPTR